MPKTVELTIEIEVQKVSCPGVWLCQDGRVSLTVFALGTSYQTCSLPPIFPLAFRDVFYFRKKYKQGCALNKMCYLLKDETIYCELVQWCNDCMTGECVMLAQYLGPLNDVLFPPNMCCSDGVDLLMRRAKDFPGILSPKIEITTKLRIDEIRSPCSFYSSSKEKEKGKQSNKESHNTGLEFESARQRQVCHSPQYHRYKCTKSKMRTLSKSSSSSSRSYLSKSNGLVTTKEDVRTSPKPLPPSRPSSARSSVPQREYSVYSVDMTCARGAVEQYCDDQKRSASETDDEYAFPNHHNKLDKILLESRYIGVEQKSEQKQKKKHLVSKVTPCVCEICQKYHEIFHMNKDS